MLVIVLPLVFFIYDTYRTLTEVKYSLFIQQIDAKMKLILIGLQLLQFCSLTSSFLIPQITSMPRKVISSVVLKMSSSSQSKPTVAIIGGGIAGLSCAQHLQSKYDATVFDTGRLRPGGRCSSRFPKDAPKNKKSNRDSILSRYTIDHAAQVLTVPVSDKGENDDFGPFRRQVDQWEEVGLVKRFPKNSVAEIVQEDTDASSVPIVRPLDSKHMYYCADGMGSIPLSMLKDNKINIRQDVWISPSNGVKFVGTEGNPQWTVQTNGKKFGTFDHVVVAHNGKCADRLMSRTPAKDLHSLLKVDFRPYVPNWGGKRMTLNSIYSLTVALKKSENGKNISDFIGDEVITAFVKNEPSLRLVTNQSLKFGNNGNDELEVWTILSSPKFAKKFKGPQENLPQERVEEVTRLMLSSFEKSLGMEEGAIDDGLVKDSKLQLWGAAVPLNVWSPTGDSVNANNSGFMYDAENAAGVCGDWLLDPSIAGAWESGRRLANWMSEGKRGDEVSVGLPRLGGEFKMSKAAEGSGIGNVN